MPLSGAEKMRRYRQRIKADATKHAEYLKDEKTRWKKRKEEGKLPTANTRSARETRYVRKVWSLERKISDEKEGGRGSRESETRIRATTNNANQLLFFENIEQWKQAENARSQETAEGQSSRISKNKGVRSKGRS